MKETEKTEIKIKIANEQLSLREPIGQQGFIRDVEANIDELYRMWRPRFPNVSESKLLAMMVYQYASFYFAIRRRYKDALGQAAEASDTLRQAIEAVAPETGHETRG